MAEAHRPFLEAVLPRMAIAVNDRVLDLGCGIGWASRAVAALTTEGMVVGIDSSGDAIREARRLSMDFENILYIEAEAEENPWQDNFFSHALLIDMIDSLRDPQSALRQLHRVMSPGGKVWIARDFASPDDQLSWTSQCLQLLESSGWIQCEREQSDCAPGLVLITGGKPPQS